MKHTEIMGIPKSITNKSSPSVVSVLNKNHADFRRFQSSFDLELSPENREIKALLNVHDRGIKCSMESRRYIRNDPDLNQISGSDFKQIKSSVTIKEIEEKKARNSSYRDR